MLELDKQSVVDKSLPLQEWEGPLEYESNDAYHADKEYLSSSDLKLALTNMMKFEHFVVRGNKKETTERLEMGTLAHDVNLEGGLSRFVVMPDFKPEKKLTKKAQVEDFEAQHKSKTIITKAQYDTLSGMHNQFYANKTIKHYMSHHDVHIEQAYRYLDVKTGMQCKFRPDIMIPSEGIIIDYKTCADASEYGFRKAIARYYYHLSAVHYLIGATRVFGKPFSQFIFIAQEKEPPYCVGLWRLSKHDIKRSSKMRRELLVKIREAIATNSFPDYSNGKVMDIYPPDYAYEIPTAGEQHGKTGTRNEVAASDGVSL